MIILGRGCIIHTHPDEGDHSGVDLAGLHNDECNMNGYPSNGFLSVVVTPGGQSYYLKVINYVEISVNFYNIRSDLQGKSFRDAYGSWYDAIGGRANAASWGLDFYDANNHLGYNQNRAKKK